MKSYDHPITVSHNLGIVDYGAGSSVQLIPVPPGMSSARIEFALLDVDETFTDDTTEGAVQIGDGTDADKFFAASTGVSAIDTAVSLDGVTEAGKFIDLARDGNGGAALTFLTVTMVAPTGGTPAGIATTTIVVSWY